MLVMHTELQLPQFLRSVWVFTHWSLQFVRPLLHDCVDAVHRPLMQFCPDKQVWPQAPQLAGLVRRL